VSCIACAAEVSPDDVFCEACGHRLSEPAPAKAGGAPVPADGGDWVTSTATAAACPRCGGVDFGAEGYCEGCGARRPTASDRATLELGGVAGVTDKGKRHHNNEDAMALGRRPGVLVGIVCDGVSSSTRPDTASHAAVDAAAPAMLAALAGGESAADAIGAAAGAAQAAATLAGGLAPSDNPPSCTFVCAVVAPDAVTVGWVGDSRAYWLPAGDPAGATMLTSDDSLAGQLAAAGIEVPAGRQGAALVRWLGADSANTEARTHTFTPTGPGRVLVCSDGVSRYLASAAELAVATPDGAPVVAATALVDMALDKGGHDNITAVVIPFPPPAPAPGGTSS
jgi:serine/threonine protein phosphatase PrpC